jgi:DNA processing protein
LSCAVVVVEAASQSGSLSTARAAGSRGAGRVLAVPGAPWDPGAAGCNDLIRDGATLVRGLDDVLEALGRTSSAVPSSNVSPGLPPPPGAAGPSAAAGVSPRLPPSRSSSGPPAAAATSPDLPRPAGHSDTPRGPPMPPSGAAPPDAVVPRGQAMPPGSTPAARTVLQALGDGRVISLARLAAATGLDAPALAAALLELELAGFVRRSAAGAEALATVPIDRGA